MTHEELLAEINQWVKDSDKRKTISKSWKALRAVVELHKPKDFYGLIVCDGCDVKLNWQIDYPCSTIQAIEKELK